MVQYALVELGFKYLLLKFIGSFEYTLDIDILSESFFYECNVNVDYMEYVDEFCELSSLYIEWMGYTLVDK